MSFSRFAGSAGIVAGLCGFAYLVALVVLQDSTTTLPSLLLMAMGVFWSALVVALYHRVLVVDAGFALWGLLLVVAGAGGAAIHGAFSLANDLHAPVSGVFRYPNPVDPRGFLTFGLAGLATVVLSALLLRGAILPRGTAILGIVSGVLLIALYVAYLAVLDVTNPVVIALVMATGVTQPAWDLWVGWLLWRGAAVAR